MAATIGPLGLALLCLQLIAVHSAASVLRGVQPELAAFYITSKDGQFRCRDGAKSIRFSQVNDGYCDCFDGSDEPGTPACPNGHFFCANTGFERRLLNSSFVDDGVCDCCDGSDEPSGRCPNRCQELGLAALESLAVEVADAESGLQARAKYIKAAISSRLAWKARILEISRVEGSAERKSKTADAARDRLVAQLSKLQAKITRMEKALQPEPTPAADTQKNAEGLAVEGGDAAAAAALAAKADDAAAGEQTEGESAEDLAKRTMSQWIPGSGQGEEDAPEDTPGDYSGGSDGDGNETEGEDDVADWDAESDSADGADDIELAAQGADSASEGTASEDSVDVGIELGVIDRFISWVAGRLAILSGKSVDAAALDQARAAVNTLQRRVDAARSQATEAASVLDSLQSEKTELERKEGMSFGPEDAYAPLAERCVEALIDKYTYKVCPFSEAEQLENGRSTSLGSWEGFDDWLEHMKFRGGEQCWQGPERSMTVRVKCGMTEGLTRVAEPSRCEYTAEMTTPAACTEEYVARLRSALASKQSLVNAIKDEL